MRCGRALVMGANAEDLREVSNGIEGAIDTRRFVQDFIYRRQVIEVPPLYIENNWRHSNVIMVGHNLASTVVLVHRVDTENPYSPGFAKAFTVPGIGVLFGTKGVSEEQVEKGMRQLVESGATTVLRWDDEEERKQLIALTRTREKGE